VLAVIREANSCFPCSAPLQLSFCARPEELGQLLDAFAIGVLDVGLETKRVAEARFREPDEA
jgi:hypothetical protein